MAEAIRLGRMTDTMEEGFIAELHIKVGDTIKPGDTIAEIETDKATLPLESYYQGTVLYVRAKQGETLKIGDLIAIVGKPGESYEHLLEGSHAAVAGENGKQPHSPTQKEAVIEIIAEPQHQQQEIESERIKASPLAKKIAKEKGIDLRNIKGTGEEGRIVKRDLEQVKHIIETPASPSVAYEESSEEIRLSPMRKAIARRLSESFFTAPHFYLTMDIRMDKATAFRNELNEATGQKISFNDLVVKAAALALREFPSVNSTWAGESIKQHKHIHIGIAVAVEEGLVVPVLRFADNKKLTELSAEAKALAQKAIDKKLLPQDMQGNTFTVSNLGMFGIEEFTAIINPPDACILSVGAIRDELVLENGEVKTSKKMKVTLGCDHRIVDGATGAKFLQVLKRNLEEPLRLLL
ncbi:MAG: dihydrolipoamide acetyltransferase family protein [Chitinophagales bacterium]|nr:2-oxo acid dehydrogenase subunit E2 [Chitinophagales bacterium]MDW8273346.1 dihydrolipoamide acetyltransferase family protein [Chitinophagales bacterium]